MGRAAATRGRACTWGEDTTEPRGEFRLVVIGVPVPEEAPLRGSPTPFGRGGYGEEGLPLGKGRRCVRACCDCLVGESSRTDAAFEVVCCSLLAGMLSAPFAGPCDVSSL